MPNRADSVFETIPVGPDEADLFNCFLDAHDLAENTRSAFTQDIRKFARWFADANQEPFCVSRVTVRDVTDFRDHLRRDKAQAVSTVNRALVTIRRFCGWLTDEGHLPANPAQAIKELRRQQLAPQGLERSQVRRLLREIELRRDVRAGALFNLFLYTGCRVSDVVQLELSDLTMRQRSGSVLFRFGKGGKQRTIPLPLPARRAVAAYLEIRPAADCANVFLGERGPLTDRGVRTLCSKYAAICRFKLFPHLLRHTMAHNYLELNGNDLVGLAQILGHENLNTTARYTQRTENQLSAAIDNLTY